MEPQLLIYKNAVPVSSEAHRDVSLRMVADFGFVRGVNAVPLVAAEFRNAAVDSMIVFAGEGAGVMPAMILGLKDAENLYVDGEGRWTGRYIPAFLRRYPFVFSAAPDQSTLTLCIDAACDRVNTAGEGEKLFDSTGAPTQYLTAMLDFARDYQAQFARTQAFCQRLVQHDLLEATHLQYTRSDGSKGRLSGFSAVSRDRLKALPQDVVQDMLQSEELEMIHVHLQSLHNLQPVLERTAAATVSEPEMA